MALWKRIFLLETSIFRLHVCFQEGKKTKLHIHMCKKAGSTTSQLVKTPKIPFLMKQADNCALDIQSHANHTSSLNSWDPLKTIPEETLLSSVSVFKTAPTISWIKSKTLKINHLEDHPMTGKWLITKVSLSPRKSRVVGPLPNGLFMAYKWWLLPILTNWDDPPSTLIFK